MKSSIPELLSNVIQDVSVTERGPRETAIAKGQLVDLSAFGANYGFVMPVGITAEAYDRVLAQVTYAGHQWVSGEAVTSLLEMVRDCCRALAALRFSTSSFETVFPHPSGEIPLLVAVGPGDNREPVLTISLLT